MTNKMFVTLTPIVNVMYVFTLSLTKRPNEQGSILFLVSLLSAPRRGRLLASPINIRNDSKSFPGTNALTHLQISQRLLKMYIYC